MKKIIILLSLIFAANIYSQDSVQYKRQVAFVPQYLFNYGIRLDFERLINDKSWLVIAPQVYMADKGETEISASTGEHSFNLVAGAGMYLGMKRYAIQDSKYGAYLGYGVSYNYFYTEYFDEGEIEPVLVKADIQKFGFDITMGYQIVIKEKAIIDMYTGLGSRISYIDNGSFSDEKFKDFPVGFNMTGNVLLLGVKVGFLY